MMSNGPVPTGADELLFSYTPDGKKEEAPAEPAALAAWKVLVADDEAQVHAATAYALRHATICDRRVELLHAYSAAEALDVLNQHPDVAVVLLDAVMEAPQAGLSIVPRIREELRMREVRIVLRTGQPGMAPEMNAIRDYDIDDYRSKADLTQSGLYAALTSAIRGFRQQREGLELYRHVLDCTNEIVFMFDPADFRLIYANHGATRHVAWRRGADPVERMFGGVFPALPREVLQSAIRSGGTEVVETDLLCDDGNRLPVEVRLESIPQRPGVGATVLAVARDLSARRRADAEKRDFLSLVSHELRTPLASVYGALDLLVNHPLEIDGAADLLSSAYDSCGSLLRLADDMLDVAKIDANRMAFRFQFVDIAVLVPEAVEALMPLAASKGVELKTSLAQASAVASVDADRFVQVLNNLLANAIRHAPPATTVEVQLRTDLYGVSVSVVDHGAGVPESFEPRLFERFARGEDSKGGSGLGLSICESLCDGMGGRIWHDRTEGGGATFSVWFPVVEAANGNAPNPASGRAA